MAAKEIIFSSAARAEIGKGLNLLANAVSFSPPGGTIRVVVRKGAGKAEVAELIAGADTLVTVMRPSAVERLGFGYEALAAKQIHVRDRSNDPATPGCIRVTAGMVTHTDAAIAALESVVARRQSR